MEYTYIEKGTVKDNILDLPQWSCSLCSDIRLRV